MPFGAGARLGPYEIVAPLGAGGMGEVYRARDTRLDREVAVKVLPEHLAKNPDALVRFEREAKAVAALSHPNIVALYDVGNERGVLYAVSELLEGETLRARVTAGPLPWRKAVEIASAIADGLSAAHAKGITHRDLKPENIFLTSDERVKILDFGLARVETSGAEGTTQTEAGTVLGTLAYMSPEQVRGEKAAAPSDLFSLGVVLYEMVAGRRAFARSTPQETMAAILNSQPEPTPAPPELSRLLQHCLEKGPQQRFQSARDLAFALRAVLSEGPSRAPREATPIDSIAVLPFVIAGGDPDAEYLSDGITENIINSLTRLPQLRVTPRGTVFRYKGREIDPQTLARELDVRAVLTGRVIQRGDTVVIGAELVDVAGQSQLWGERYNRKLADVFAIEEEIARNISEALRLKLTVEEKSRLAQRPTEDSEAYQLYLKGRYAFYKRTVGSLRQAIEYYQQAIEKDREYALAYTGSADCFLLLAALGAMPSREACLTARDAAARAVAIDPSRAEPHTSLGALSAMYDWDLARAEKEFLRAIELDPRYWQAHTWYAMSVLAPTRRLQEAAEEVRKALELEPLSPVVNYHAALVFVLGRRSEEAIAAGRKVQALDPSYPWGHFWLGLAYEQQGRFGEAIAALSKSVELFGDSCIPASALGHAYAVSGERAKAESIRAEWTAAPQSRYLEPFWMAALCAGLDDREGTFSWLSRAAEDRSLWLSLFLNDPRLDAVRSDPRFEALRARIGLP